MEEEQLIKDLKDNDDESFIQIVNQYKKKVMSLCYSYVYDYQEAEDLSQEVFISFYKSIKNFRGECSISTYIYKITISKCLDFKRKKSIKCFLNGIISFQNCDENDIDERNYIKQCVLELPEELRICVILYYYTGINQKEISEILNLSTKTVEGRIYRAKQKLKVKLEKEGFLECSKSGII